MKGKITFAEVNVQQTIVKGIREQLFLHNYLVLPGFGGFVLRPLSSHFSGGGSLLSPPSKTVSFNAQLKQNDGVLSFWLQQELKCGAQAAMKHLEEFSEYCTSILSNKRRLLLQEIGFFYLDFEDNICFEPQQDANFLTASFGLTPVSATLIPQAEETRKINYVDRQAPVPLPEKTRRSYRPMVIPLVIGALFFSLLALFVSGLKMNGRMMSALFTSEKTSRYIPVHYPELTLSYSQKDPPAYVIDANGIASLDLGTKQIAVRAIPEVLTVETRSSGKKHRKLNHQYEIVVGCFSIPENAQRLVRTLKAEKLNAYIHERNDKGLYIVSYGSFENKAEALSKLGTVKEVVPTAWVRTP